MKKQFLFLFFILSFLSTRAQIFNHIDSLMNWVKNPIFLNDFLISDDDSIPAIKKIRNLDLIKSIPIYSQRFYIENSSITEIKELDSFLGVSQLIINNNGYLKSITGLENAKWITKFEITSNSALQVIDLNFKKVKEMNSISIMDNLSLKLIKLNIEEMRNDSIKIAPNNIKNSFTLRMSDNDSLEVVNYTSKYRVLSWLDCQRNKKLKSISINKFNYDYWNIFSKDDFVYYNVGKAHYKSVILLKDNPQLYMLNGFNDDSITISHCEIERNPLLTNLCKFQYYFTHFKFPTLDTQKYFIIDSNGIGANSMSEVKTKNCITASLSQNPFINSFVAYPNPTNEFLYFKNINSNASIQSISVYNLLGMNCNSLIENGNDFIDVRKLKEGIYNLIIVEESGKKSTNYFYKNGN